MSKFVIGFLLVCAAFPEWPAHAIERGQDLIKLVSLDDGLYVLTDSR